MHVNAQAEIPALFDVTRRAMKPGSYDGLSLEAYHASAGISSSGLKLIGRSPLTAEERERLVDHLSERFGVDKAEASAVLDEQGLPIRASTCGVTVLNPQRWL